MNNICHCANALDRAKMTFMRRVVWKKPDGVGIPVHGHTHKKPHGLNWNPKMVTEDVLIYTRGKKRVPVPEEPFDTALFSKFYTDCWQFKGITSDKKLGHPAAFPVLLPQLLISFLTLKNEIIGEPFCGSGTTIIAAQMLGRTCYAAELQPKYVDLAVARWEQFTGRRAERVKEGKAQPR
jgi:DNA modification methylase